MTRRCHVLLAVLPFAKVSQPVLGVSILKAAAAAAGFPVCVRYFDLDFAERTGLPLYRGIASSFGSHTLMGDWIFAEALFGKRLPSADRFLAHLRADYSRLEDGIFYGVRFSGGRNFTQYIEQDLWPELLRARKLAGESVEEWAKEILAREPRVVGFTVSSQQACACLAVARRLKKSPNAPIIIFGGPNCHEEMGQHCLNCFPWIDYVCNGEADDTFPSFLRKVLRQDDGQSIPGILSRKKSASFSDPQPLRDLDKSPLPDYSDYFEQLRKPGPRSEIGAPSLPLETSRGCWWGEKCQCVFCGDHRRGIVYRSKSGPRILREIKSLADQYQFSSFFCVDDAMDRKHIETVFRRLAENGSKRSFYYQTRPELNRDELRTLSAGGVKMIQPGIESFSDAVLRLMRKGALGLRNVQLLRCCREVGIEVSWRILYGFPGEPVAEYDRMAGLVPLLTHLPPPLGTVQVALKRFSPHWLNPEHYGLTDVQPWPSYSYVYPFRRKKLEGIACFFAFQYADGRKPFEYSRSLRREVGNWIELWQTPDGSHPHLDLCVAGEEVVITDTRPCAARRTHRLRGLTAKVLLQCDSVQSTNALLRAFGPQAGDAAVERSLGELAANRLLIENGGRYLSLAVMQEPVRTL